MADSVLVVCPGRGTYGAAELGYLGRHHAASPLIEGFDARRRAGAKPTVTELDSAATFSSKLHGRGEHAASSIYSAGILDFLALDPAKTKVVAVCGNSMGWYTALACAGVVSSAHGFAIADAMGANSGTGQGGQLLLTLVGDDWRAEPGLRRAVLAAVAKIEGVFSSIELGGMLLIAGTEEGLAELERDLPSLPGRAPIRLAGHGPFHTPLMRESSRRALADLPLAWFAQPQLPLVDGQGRIWRPHSSSPGAIYDYTFTTQILEPYDFTLSLSVALKEFAPNRIVLLGPGETMGGAIGQVLVARQWLGLTSKAAFVERQNADPFLVAMNRAEQRERVA